LGARCTAEPPYHTYLLARVVATAPDSILFIFTSRSSIYSRSSCSISGSFVKILAWTRTLSQLTATFVQQLQTFIMPKANPTRKTKATRETGGRKKKGESPRPLSLTSVD
jgi:hypothetical protein